jgi:hypothetical protein
VLAAWDYQVDGGATGVPHHGRICKLCDADNGHPGTVAAEGDGSGHPTLSCNHDTPTRRGVSIMKADRRLTHSFQTVSYSYSVKRYSYSRSS